MSGPMMKRLAWIVMFGSLVSFGIPANAHISLEQGGTHNSSFGPNADIKFAPCGPQGDPVHPRTSVYTYAPGQTITLSVKETIAHPGYFRIAFQRDGDNLYIDPQSIDPLDSQRSVSGSGCVSDRFGGQRILPCPKCMPGTTPADLCGTTDFMNTRDVNTNIVLMDNLDPHIQAPANPIHTWQVTLPNIECANCTLQVI